MTQPVQPERQEARLLARLWPTGPVDVAVRLALAVPLGLALVAKIVGDHGGVIDSDSRPGRTRFRVLLPVAHGVSAREPMELVAT